MDEGKETVTELNPGIFQIRGLNGSSIVRIKGEYRTVMIAPATRMFGGCRGVSENRRKARYQSSHQLDEHAITSVPIVTFRSRR